MFIFVFIYIFGSDFCGSRKDTCFQPTERLRFSLSLSADGLFVQGNGGSEKRIPRGETFCSTYARHLEKIGQRGYFHQSVGLLRSVNRVASGRAVLSKVRDAGCRSMRLGAVLRQDFAERDLRLFWHARGCTSLFPRLPGVRLSSGLTSG